MPADHITVTFAHMSGLTRDQVVNSFAIGNVEPIDDPTRLLVKAAINKFYNTAASGTGRSLSSFFSSCLSRTVAPVIRFYDITGHENGTPSGSPVLVDAISPIAAAGTPLVLPSEVACTYSFHSDFGTDVEFAPGTRPRARDRGRIYVGPLNQDALQQDGTTFRSMPHANLRDTLNQVGQTLKTDIEAAGPAWCTWSRKAARLSAVIGSSVDDAFDTQRRRGERAIAKSMVTFV